MCRYLKTISNWSLFIAIIMFIASGCTTTTDSQTAEDSDTPEVMEVAVAEEEKPSATVYEVDSAVEVEDLPTTPEANQVTLKASAPEQYIVQKGDTLWGLSNKFLNQPWYWPEIWYMNPQVNNPHLIYPGDVINVFYVGGRPYLTVNSETRVTGIERLSPSMRGEPIEATQKVIPIQIIEQFLTRPQIVDANQLEESPHIVGSRDNRIIYGANDSVYARGANNLTEESKLHVYRPGTVFKDPDTGDVLGYEAIHVGDGEIVNEGDPATVYLTSATREVLRGDRLLEIETIDADTAFYPRAPSEEIDGKVIHLSDAITQVGTYQIVVSNVGKTQGLEKGHVVTINKAGRLTRDAYAKKDQSEEIQLPNEPTADAIVFRVFDNISYLFILDADRPVRPGDVVTSSLY